MNATEATIKALIVDDDEEFADTVATVLEREDSRFDVRTATTVDEGLDAIEVGLVDCVVSDYRMPGTDGLEFLETVRADHGELPFVLLTGEGDESIASDAISAGVTDYFRKEPGDDQFSLLVNRLADAVESRRARSSLRRRKQELERLNDRFQSFVRHSPDIVTVLDDEGTIRYNSPAIERVLGYDQDAPVGDTVEPYVHPEDLEALKTEFEEYMREGGDSRRSFEYRALQPDGESVWVESIVSKRPEGGGGGFLVNTRDISDRKARERELEAKTTRLDEFASIVSHDLQTPITVADARLENAMDECDSEHLPPIGDALDRMDEIIDATLTLAREGQVVDETEPVELTGAIDRWSDTIESDGLTVEIEPDQLRIEADPERLRHVVENLLANAVDHAGEDATVVVDKLDDEGFYVADDGPGIPEDVGEEIFEPGQSTSPDGTGFGLAIVEEIVAAHGWAIEATESEFGGARFEINGVDFV